MYRAVLYNSIHKKNLTNGGLRYLLFGTSFLHCPPGLMFDGRISCPCLHFRYAMVIASGYKIQLPEGGDGGFCWSVGRERPQIVCS